MLAFDIDARELRRIADEFAATPKEVEMAGRRANKRTAASLRRLASRGLKSELGLRNTKALRRRIKEYRVGQKGDQLKIWFGTNDLPVSAFKGRPVEVAGGVKIGEVMIYGAFLATVSGRRSAWRRLTGRAFPIAEAKVPVADRVMTFVEDEVFVDIEAIWFKHFASEIRARTILGVGGKYG